MGKQCLRTLDTVTYSITPAAPFDRDIVGDTGGPRCETGLCVHASHVYMRMEIHQVHA